MLKSLHPGRGDASDAHTDPDSFAVLEPVSDGFRNFLLKNYSVSPEEMMLDKAQLLGLSAPEMTVLVGGLRSMGVSSDDRGIFSDGNTLSTDFFTTLIDMNVKWKATGSNSYEAHDRSSGELVRRATRYDLVFWKQLTTARNCRRDVCPRRQRGQAFVQAISSAAWNKVMNADRFDVA